MNLDQATRPKIAVFDYFVRSDNAMGSCHLHMLAGLCHKYDFTVFAIEFENPAPERIKFVRIPVPARPTILLASLYQVLAPIYYAAYRLKNHIRFDIVEKMEVFTFLGSIAYLHFCYRAYLQNHWRSSRQPGLRGALLTFDHAIRAYILEPIIYRMADKLVVPSQGLARELVAAYPFTRDKISLLPNSADYRRLSRPDSSFLRDEFRQRFGVVPDEFLLVFIALGQFERKGLPQLLDAMAVVRKPHIKLLIVGGSKHWMDQYATRARALGIENNILFAGMQRDVAPFLWAGDVFTLPSLYEVFPLVAIEAAAAGVAMLITHLNGVEDYIVDGESGIYVDRTVESIAAAILHLDEAGPAERKRLGQAAQRAALPFSREAFVSNWDKLLNSQLCLKGHPSRNIREECEHAPS